MVLVKTIFVQCSSSFLEMDVNMLDNVQKGLSTSKARMYMCYSRAKGCQARPVSARIQRCDLTKTCTSLKCVDKVDVERLPSLSEKSSNGDHHLK